jgi:hypothetical protein
MKKRRFIFGVVVGFGLFIFFSLILIAESPVEADSEPRLNHSACTAQCVVDQIFLHSDAGDTMAKNEFYDWKNSYYDLTGCNESTVESAFKYFVDVLGDAVGAPGAPTMQCWQGLLAQTHNCSNICSE